MLLSIMSSRTSSYAQFVTVLLIFLFVMAITWFTTRWIAKIQQGQMASRGANLEIIETQRLSPDKYIEIVRAGDKYLVIAVGKSEVHMLTELDVSEINLSAYNGQSMDFKSIFNKIKDSSKNTDDNSLTNKED